MLYLWYIFFALAPSLIWLLFFLRKDAHPESNRMVLRVFFYGILSAVFLWLILKIERESLESLSLFIGIPWVVLGSVVAAPVLEETAKYLVVRLSVIHHWEFDEPVDAMLYMIIAALGFTATENLLYLIDGGRLLFESFLIILIRFVGPIFLHALVSGLVGYYLALSFFHLKKRARLICQGLIMAMILHGLFNLSIIGIEGSLREMGGQLMIVNRPLFMISAGVIIFLFIGLAIFVIYGFKKVKQLKSVCKM